MQINSDKMPEGEVENKDRGERYKDITRERDEHALTDTGRLAAGPGEIWQTEPGGGALQ